MRKIAILFAVLFLSTAAVFAQTKIRGKVTEANGSPVVGATIKVKGEKTSAVSGADGSFEIMAKSGNVLEISEISHLPQTLSYDGSAELTVKLLQDTKSLSEVVVTGIGVATSRKKLAIDVGTLNAKDVSKSAIGSIEQALVGKIAGANIQFLSGTPGSAPTIILRALNDFHYTPPLIMLDGIEVSSLNGLDLGTVERVEVVKGAAGGMLYGAQGGNGVIQVFTKKGARNRKLEINFTSQASSGSVITNEDVIAKHHSFETDAQGYITQGGVRITPDATGAWPKGDFMTTGVNPSLKNDKVYQELLYDHLKQAYKNASTFYNTLNLSGGGEKTDYAFTLSRYDEQNVLSNKFEKTSLGANIGFELAKGLTFRNNVQVIYTNENLSSGDPDPSIGNTGTERFSILTAFPFIDYLKRDSTGHLIVNPRSDDPGSKNPLSEQEWRDRSSTNTRVIENVNLNYKFPRFFEIDYKYGIEINNTEDKSYYYNQTSSLQAGVGYWGQSVNGGITNTLSNYKQQNSLLSGYLKLDFEKDFHLDIPIKAVTQYSYDYRRYDTRQSVAQGNGLPPYPPANIGVAADRTAYDYYSTIVTFGYLFNQSIDYKDLVGISGGFRTDYSSGYGSGKPKTFPRGTIYFRPSELWDMGALKNWKLRAAYGEAGIPPYIYANQTTLIVAPLGNISTLSSGAERHNPDIQVELSKELEIGTDFNFKPGSGKWFQNIGVGFTYWKRTTDGVFQFQDLPSSSGSTKVLDNLSTIEAKGLDLSIDADVLTSKSLDWQFGFRIGTTKSVATSVAAGANIVQGVFTIQEGQELGLFNLQAPLSSLDQLRTDKTPYIDAADRGKYEVVNGVVVDTATKAAIMGDADDPKIAGSAMPDFKASFFNTLVFNKNLTLSFQLDWSYGNKVYNMTRQWLYRDRLSADYDKAVTINGQTGAYVNYYNALYNSVSPSTWFVEDASYLRLRDLSLTYNFTDLLHAKWIKQLGLTVSARNILTITNYSGLDVEATTTSDSQGNEAKGGYSAAVNGVDYFAVPNLKSYQISLRVSF